MLKIVIGNFRKYENKAHIISVISNIHVSDENYWQWETNDQHVLVRMVKGISAKNIIEEERVSGVKLQDILEINTEKGLSGKTSGEHLLQCMERRLAFRDLDVALNSGGPLAWVQMTGRPVYKNGTFIGYSGVGRDVPKGRSLEKVWGQQSRVDRNTGLPNRLAIVEHLQHLLFERSLSAEDIVVCMVSLPPNTDAKNELIKSAFLRDAAMRLMRGEECLYVGRYNANDLAVLVVRNRLSDCFDRLAVEAMIHRFCTALADDMIFTDAHKKVASPKIGAVLSTANNQRADILLDAAETVLRDVERFENTAFFIVDKIITYGGERPFRLSDDVREAVEKREFNLVFQPILHAQTGRIVGCEALSRWRGSVSGQTSMQNVIALIEENGQSETFDYWVLEKACQAASRWPQDMWVSVNMAAMHFSVPQMAERVLEIVHRSGVRPNQLQIEITETFALEVGPQVSHSLMLLDRAGIKLALDDFGTGYSSANYLRMYPFTKIKVDAGIIQDVLYNAKSKGVLRSILELSVDLGLVVTAEGVSSAEHYRFLRDCGCTEVQGFYLGRPMPEKQLDWTLSVLQEHLH
ncbi:PAS domain-containing protein [Neokomagataea thailandica NBRC 106555]|nr:PAS domain-containing protein [Neokomagataea thailandica NBRC 106555]